MHLWGMPCSDQCSRCTFSIGLFDDADIGELGRKSNLSDEVCMEELFDFFFDDFTPLLSGLPFLL